MTSDYFLSHANCYASIGNDVFVGSYLSKIIIGNTETDKHAQVKFDTKSLLIPSNCFFRFVDAIHLAHRAYRTESKEPFQATICQTSPLYPLMACYNEYEDRWRFQLRVFWRHKKDRKFLQAVERGELEPVKSTDDLVPISRGLVLNEDQVDQLFYQLPSILEHTFMDHNGMRDCIKELIDYISEDGCEHQDQYIEKLKDFTIMNHGDKLQMLDDLVHIVKTDCEKPATKEEIRAFGDKLKLQVNLVFTLLRHALY